MPLIEEGAILRGEFRLGGGKVGLGEDSVLSAEIGATAAIDAIIGVDEYLGNAIGTGVALHRSNGRGGTFRHADKILDARIRYHVCHKDKLLCVRAPLFLRRRLDCEVIEGGPRISVTRITTG